jgi:hypothetical protein
VLALDRYYPGQKFDTDAKSMAKVIYNSFYVTPVADLSDSTQNFYWISFTGAVEAFTTTGLHPEKRDSLKSALLASQLVDGSFESAPQTTAYAVLALLKAGENDAAKKGVKYLVTNQSVNGGWVEDPTANPKVENPEDTSEAIQAIYNFQK